MVEQDKASTFEVIYKIQVGLSSVLEDARNKLSLKLFNITYSNMKKDPEGYAAKIAAIDVMLPEKTKIDLWK